MRGWLGKTLLIQFLVVGNAYGDGLEHLSKAAFLATGNECQSYDEKSAKIGIKYLCASKANSAEDSIRNLAEFLNEDAEDQLFVHLAKQQVLELNCAQDYAKSISSAPVKSEMLENIQAKLDLARLYKQKLAKASKKLATSRKVISRVCPNDITTLDAETPTELKGEKTYQLCQEIIVNRAAYFATVSNIPLAGVSDVQSYIEKYTSAKEEPAKNGELQEAYKRAVSTLRNGAQNLSDSLTKGGSKALSRGDRHALLQDPAVAEEVLNNVPVERRMDVRGLLCEANAHYGKGADALEGGVMVISLAFSGGVGIWARASAVGKAAVIGANGRQVALMSFSSMRTIQTLRLAALGGESAANMIAVKRACESKILPDLKTKGACTSAPSVEKTAHEDCILMATLSAMGTASLVPEGYAKKLGQVVSEKASIVTSGIKGVSNADDLQSAIWAKRASGELAVAQRMEQELTDVLKNQKIVASRPIGKGASKPFYVKLEDGTEGVWKKNFGWPANGDSEIEAYKASQELGADLVGVTVPKEFNGVPGTLQVRVAKLKKQKLPSHPDQLSWFDYLIGNTDRHKGNYLQTQSGHLVAIDHGLSNGDSTSMLVQFKSKVITLKAKIDERTKIESQLAALRANPSTSERTSMLERDYVKEIKKSKREESKLQSDIASLLPEKKVVDKMRRTSASRWKEVLGVNASEERVELIHRRQQNLLESIDEAEQLIGPDRLYREGPVSPLMNTQPADIGYPAGATLPIFPLRK